MSCRLPLTLSINMASRRPASDHPAPTLPVTLPYPLRAPSLIATRYSSLRRLEKIKRNPRRDDCPRELPDGGRLQIQRRPHTSVLTPGGRASTLEGTVKRNGDLALIRLTHTPGLMANPPTSIRQIIPLSTRQSRAAVQPLGRPAHASRWVGRATYAWIEREPSAGEEAGEWVPRRREAGWAGCGLGDLMLVTADLSSDLEPFRAMLTRTPAARPPARSSSARPSVRPPVHPPVRPPARRAACRAVTLVRRPMNP